MKNRTPNTTLALDEAQWKAGSEPAAYFDSLSNYRHLVLSLYRDVTVGPDERAAVADALAAAGGRANTRILVVTEDWCGDSACTLPYIARLAEDVGVAMRIFRQSAFPELKEWFVARAIDHIPAVSVVARAEASTAEASGVVRRELTHWVERPAKAHAHVEGWLESHPRFFDLYRAKDSDPDAAKEYFNLYGALLREMAGWYRRGLWAEIARELAEGLSHGAAPTA
jgi:hypothetical protein